PDAVSNTAAPLDSSAAEALPQCMRTDWLLRLPYTVSTRTQIAATFATLSHVSIWCGRRVVLLALVKRMSAPSAFAAVKMAEWVLSSRTRTGNPVTFLKIPAPVPVVLITTCLWPDHSVL